MTDSSDTYRTITGPASGVFRDRGSRFLAMAYPVSEPDQVKEIVEGLRKEHHNARHHCYAYMLGADRLQWRANDDGEPSGTAGRPILGQINSNELTDILIVVVRYFGGTLLGVSGLINAYRAAASDALANSDIVSRKVMVNMKIRFPYEVLNEVMRIVKDCEAVPGEQSYSADCLMEFSLPRSLAAQAEARLTLLKEMEILTV